MNLNEITPQPPPLDPTHEWKPTRRDVAEQELLAEFLESDRVLSDDEWERLCEERANVRRFIGE